MLIKLLTDDKSVHEEMCIKALLDALRRWCYHNPLMSNYTFIPLVNILFEAILQLSLTSAPMCIDVPKIGIKNLMEKYLRGSNRANCEYFLS